MVALLRELYDGDTPRAHRFRYALLAFDLVTVVFIVATSFINDRGPLLDYFNVPLLEFVDVAIGLAITADFSARLLVSRHRIRDLFRLSTIADIVAIASFVAPVTGEGGGFLRILRTLRLLRTYNVAAKLRSDLPFFRQNEDAILAVANLGVFLFVMTGIIYETQHRSNPDIRNYADALYFTVTTLTTTGFGDITLPGTTGRLLSVVVMIFGVTLFLRLAQVLFRPYKVTFSCPSCGLQRHDPDAVHCKACGALINIPDEGVY